MSGYNLPPGVTTQMIDEALGVWPRYPKFTPNTVARDGECGLCDELALVRRETRTDTWVCSGCETQWEAEGLD